MRPDAIPPMHEVPLRTYWREAGEPSDGRPLIWRRPFWRSEEEASAYLTAVKNNPRQVDLERDEIESATAYIQRIASIALQAYVPPPAKRFPLAHRWNREYTGARETVTEGNLSFEDHTNEIFDREPGSDDE